MWYWHKDRCKIKGKKFRVHKKHTSMANCSSTRSPRHSIEKEKFLKQMVLEQMNIHMKKNEI